MSDIPFNALCEELGKDPSEFAGFLARYEALQTMVTLAKNDPERIGWAVFTACQMGEGSVTPGQAVALVFGGPREVSNAQVS